jgi:hypothetical protein
MGEARRATAADADELVRLRAVLLAHMSGRDPAGDDWRQAAAGMFRATLDGPDPTMAALVVDRPGRARWRPARSAPSTSLADRPR